MNWYFLAPRQLLPAGLDPDHPRDHLLEAAECRLDIVSGRYVVLDLVHERGKGDAPRVRGSDIAAKIVSVVPPSA